MPLTSGWSTATALPAARLTRTCVLQAARASRTTSSIGASARDTQQALADQLEELAQLTEWAVQAALELKKEADAGVLNLGQERSRRWKDSRTSGCNCRTSGSSWSRLRVTPSRLPCGSMGSSSVSRSGTPRLSRSHDIQQAAAQVRHNVKETKWLDRPDVLRPRVVGVCARRLAFAKQVERHAGTDEPDRAVPGCSKADVAGFRNVGAACAGS